MASTYLSRTISVGGDRQIMTFSAWVKRATASATTQIFTTGTGGERDMLLFESGGQIQFSRYNNSYIYNLKTNRLFRDTSAWYHVVAVFNSTEATSSDRMKLYINGVQETSFSTETYPSLNYNSNYNQSTFTQYVGQDSDGNFDFDGSMAHVHYIDGTAYDASAFGETDATTGIWKPKTAPSVTYGTNGVFLKFENSGAFGTDSSGNGNNFTVNGTMTQTIDTPSNVFATLNPLHPGLTSFSNVNFLNGNTTFDNNETGGSIYPIAKSTLAVSSGKYYAEFKQNESGGGLGISDGKSDENFLGDNTSNGVHYRSDGNKRVNNVESAFGDSYTTNDIIGVAMDLDNNYVYFSKNGTWQNSGDPTSGATGTGGISIPTSSTGVFHFAVTEIGSSSTSNISANFGNGTFGTTAVSSAQNPDDGIGIFEFSPPTGYRALCTKSINAEEYS